MRAAPACAATTTAARRLPAKSARQFPAPSTPSALMSAAPACQAMPNAPSPDASTGCRCSDRYCDETCSDPSRRLRRTGARSILIVAHQLGELVVVLGDDLDVALVLDRRLGRFQGGVEIGQCLLLVGGGHLLVGLDLRDLRFDNGFTADIFLGGGIEAAEHEADIVHHAVVFVVARKAVLLRDSV